MNTKTVALLFAIFILVASSLYLVYLISDGSNPIALFNSRAAEEDVPNNTDMAPTDLSPTPTIPYNSTSPTLKPGTTAPSGKPTLAPTAGNTKTTLTPKATATPTKSSLPLNSPTPTSLPAPSPTPTPIKELPVAGVTDYLNPFILSGVLLIFVALAL